LRSTANSPPRKAPYREGVSTDGAILGGAASSLWARAAGAKARTQLVAARKSTLRNNRLRREAIRALSHAARLHVGVVRASAAFGRRPHDVLRGILDVAGFAVDAVLGVDLEARVLPLVVVEDLIDARRAIALRRLGELRQVHPDRDRGVDKLQMRRLVF